MIPLISADLHSHAQASQTVRLCAGRKASARKANTKETSTLTFSSRILTSRLLVSPSWYIIYKGCPLIFIMMATRSLESNGEVFNCNGTIIQWNNTSVSSLGFHRHGHHLHFWTLIWKFPHLPILNIIVFFIPWASTFTAAWTFSSSSIANWSQNNPRWIERPVRGDQDGLKRTQQRLQPRQRPTISNMMELDSFYHRTAESGKPRNSALDSFCQEESGDLLKRSMKYM